MIPLFIGGTGRSGTTITLEYLGNHSKIYASDPLEIRFLTDQYGLLDLFDSKNLDEFLINFEKKWIGPTKQTIGINISIDNKKINEMIHAISKNFNNDTKKSIRTFYFNTFVNQINFKKDCSYIGDSTPSNIRFANRILNILPESKFIHLYRDGRDSAYSMYLMREYFDLPGKKTEFDALEWWYDRTVQSFQTLSKIPKEKYINVRLEELVKLQPEIEKNKILTFLGISNEKTIENYFIDNIKEENMSKNTWTNLKNWKKFDNHYSFLLKKLNEKNIFIEKYY